MAFLYALCSPTTATNTGLLPSAIKRKPICIPILVSLFYFTGLRVGPLFAEVELLLTALLALLIFCSDVNEEVKSS